MSSSLSYGEACLTFLTVRDKCSVDKLYQCSACDNAAPVSSVPAGDRPPGRAALSDGGVARPPRLAQLEDDRPLLRVPRLSADLDVLLAADRPQVLQGARHQVHLPPGLAHLLHRAADPDGGDAALAHLDEHQSGAARARVDGVHVAVGHAALRADQPARPGRTGDAEDSVSVRRRAGAGSAPDRVRLQLRPRSTGCAVSDGRCGDGERGGVPTI